MSDTPLSQNEIDALLSGLPTESSGSGAEQDFTVLQEFVNQSAMSLKSNLEMMMPGSEFVVSEPTVAAVKKDEWLPSLPENVVAVPADFSAVIEGDHLFLLDEEFAKKVAGLSNGEEITELDDMAMSIIAEVISTQTGAEITELSSKGKVPGLACNPPEAMKVPKNMVRYPNGHFVAFSYKISVGGENFVLWELVSNSVAQSMAEAFSSAPVIAKAAPAASVGSYSAPAGGPQMPNVQSVNFSNLQNGVSSAEAGNIGLILDVFMEMTVELGRTKKQIKEILSIGEGTIIELDKLAGEPVDILVNHKAIAKGEVVVIDENFGVRVTEILPPGERMSDLM